MSSYAEFHASEMTEWQFLTEVVELADCGILLDVNNIYVSFRETTVSIPWITSTGFQRSEWRRFISQDTRKFEKYILDTHDHPVIDPVWKLYSRAIERAGRTATCFSSGTTKFHPLKRFKQSKALKANTSSLQKWRSHHEPTRNPAYSTAC